MKSRNVQHITGYIKSIIYDVIYIFPSTKHDKYNTCYNEAKTG